jgi:phage terminase large subunit
MQRVNKHYEPLFRGVKGVRYYIHMGGRGAGRSTTGSQFALMRLRDTTRYFRCAIMRFVYGDIRNSIYQDIEDRIDEQGLDEYIEASDHRLFFKYKKNTIKGIGFRKSSGDQKSKMKSLANYNCVIIEEADEVAEEDFMQLDDSLRKANADIIVILQLNPPDKNHWIIKRWFNLVDSGIPGFYKAVPKKGLTDSIAVSTTYKENIANINPSSAANYERYKETNPEYYYNSICGLVSEGLVGRIFKNWQPMTVEEFEALPYPSIYALDFGFSNDPSALIEIKYHNNKVYVRELIYQTGLTNPMLSKRFEDLGLSYDDIIYADCAEPKSIQELCDLGWYVEPSEKGADSVIAGINMLLEKEVHYTEDSENIALEHENYKWRLDKNKEPTNKPEDKNNHAMDAIRYGVFTDSRTEFVGFAGG